MAYDPFHARDKEHYPVPALDLRSTEDMDAAEELAQTSSFFREEILGLPARPGVIR